jgi:C-terminal processing protease CtpA/Prc
MFTCFRRPLLTAATALLAAVLAACGGGSGGNGATTGGACSVTNQKQFVLDATREWYLFQDLLPPSVSIGDYANAQDLLDALTATARTQGKDRFFSYLTTPAADSSFLQEGQFIGFGIRTSIQGNRLFVPDVFEASPAADGGLTRGAEIIAVDSGSGFIPMATILQTDPNLEQAFGPATQGVQRGIRFLRVTGQQAPDVTLTKRIVTILPVPTTGGTAILALPSNPTVQVGYINLRTFISTADAPLRSAYASFLALGIHNIIVDLRYNGGGLVSIAELLGDLHGGGLTGSIYSNTLFNTAKASNNSVRRFQSQPQSVAPVRIAFITTGGTASASELVVNSMKPWVEVAIVGADTFGKPVGQFAFDLTGCDLRLRLITFRTTNANNEGDYYDGLASTIPFACAAADDLTQAPGNVFETSTSAALNWLGTGACGQVMSAPAPGLRLTLAPARIPVPKTPTPAQAYLPGLF